jgi:hypothetical protein
MPPDIENVCLSGQTGSGSDIVKPTQLTQLRHWPRPTAMPKESARANGDAEQVGKRGGGDDVRYDPNEMS